MSTARRAPLWNRLLLLLGGLVFAVLFAVLFAEVLIEGAARRGFSL